MPSKRTLYGVSLSPPVRAVQLTLAALDLDYELKFVDTYAEKSKEFLAKNPQGTIPTLEEEDGHCIWDSHAINAYLVRRYGKNDSLYPKGFYERAVVDQRLHYENGVIFAGVASLFKGLRAEGTKAKLLEVQQKVYEMFTMLETFLGDNQFMAGNNLTIADFSIVSNLQSMSIFTPITADKLPKLAAWFERMKKLPYYEKVSAEPMKQMEAKIKAAVDALV